MRNKKGFTLVELMITLTVLLALLLPGWLDKAHGMELGKYYEASQTNLNVVSSLMRGDPILTVIVVIYAKEWTVDGRETDMVGPGMKYTNILIGKFGGQRVSVLLANEPGLKEDPMPVPPKNGVYFYLD